jgi:hypothetical protein
MENTTFTQEHLICDTLGRHLFSGLRTLAEAWTNVILNVTRDDSQPLAFEFRFDWVRDAAMSAIELGLPLRPEPILRLLTDRQYFESLLPMPASDPRWKTRSKSGTEVLWQWWNVYPDEYRNHQTHFIQQLFQQLPPGAFRCLSSYELARELS